MSVRSLQIDRPRPPTELGRIHAARHNRADEAMDWESPLDRSRWFICPSLTPLFYTPIYRDLSSEQQHHYNHLSALLGNEVISFFETTLLAALSSALTVARQRNDDALAECVNGFVEDEREHTQWWGRLSRLTAPEWYGQSARRFLWMPRLAERCVHRVAAKIERFPIFLIFILLMEEHGVEVSRRCLLLPKEQIEPRYRATYHRHMEDEVRHVQIDWHLIHRFYPQQPLRRRQAQAAVFRRVVEWFFVGPGRSADRLVRQLIHDFPTLAGARREMTAQLRCVATDPAYMDMMYSRRSAPTSFALYDSFPEFRVMAKALPTYVPAAGATAHD